VCVRVRVGVRKVVRIFRRSRRRPSAIT